MGDPKNVPDLLQQTATEGEKMLRDMKDVTDKSIGQAIRESERYNQRDEIAGIIRGYFQERQHEVETEKQAEQLDGMRIACQDLYGRITGDDKVIELEVRDGNIPVDPHPF